MLVKSLHYFLFLSFLIKTFSLRISKELGERCIIKTEKGVLDITQAVPPSEQHSMYNATSNDGKRTTFWSPCSDSKLPGCGTKGSVIQRSTANNCTVLSSVEDSYFLIKDNKIYVHYIGSSAIPDTHILLTCTALESDIDFVEDSACNTPMAGNCFTFSHPFCCLDTSVYASMIAASDEPAASAASAAVSCGGNSSQGLLIALLVVVFAFAICVLGFILLEYVRSARGSTFWHFTEINRTLPRLLEEGCVYVAEGGKLVKRSSDYDNI